MKEVKKVQETIENCQSQLEEIEAVRSTVEARYLEAKSHLTQLTLKLPGLLVEREFGKVPDSKVQETKAEIAKQDEVISDIPLIFGGLEAHKSAINRKLEDAQDKLEEYQHKIELEKVRQYIQQNIFGREFKLIAVPPNVNWGPGEYNITLEVDENGGVTGRATAQHLNEVPGSYEQITGTISPTGRVEIYAKASFYYGKSVGDYRVKGDITRDGGIHLHCQAGVESNPPGNFKVEGRLGEEIIAKAPHSYNSPGNYRVRSA